MNYNHYSMKVCQYEPGITWDLTYLIVSYATRRKN